LKNLGQWETILGAQNIGLRRPKEMASIVKRGKTWRAQISVKGARDSSVFNTKAEATAWAVEREAQMRRMAATGINTDKTCQDAFDRYVDTVSSQKRGAKWERTRLTFLSNFKINGRTLGSMPLCEITSDTLAKWRDIRLTGSDGLRPVKGSTINRDFALLSNLFATARTEWKWLAASPTSDVRRPASEPSRDKLITEDEIGRICQSLGYAGEVRTKSDKVAVAFLFAIETAMRAGEICRLRRSLVRGNVAHLPSVVNKNGIKRDVPLSGRALELLALLPDNGDEYFSMTSDQLDALFRKGRDVADVGNLTFHDTRHLAITRLARKLNILELARMVGHKDLKTLQIYYNETAEEIAKKL
jgi:integrase